MAISLGSIIVELLANTGGFIEGMSKASYQGKKAAKEIHESFSDMGEKIGSATQGALSSLGQFGAVAGEFARSMGEAFDGLGKGSNGIAVAVTALGGLATAAIAAGAGLLELGKSGAELVEHLSLVSQKTGISIRDLQIMQAAGATVGVSLDDMVIGLRKFDQALLNTGKGAAAQGVLKELGVTARDNKEALLQAADAFSKMEDGPRKAADAVALFGKSGLQLIPLLNQGREGIEEWSKAVDRLGPKIGKQAVEANEQYKRSVTELGLAWDKIKVDVEQSVVPALAKAGSWLANNLDSIKAGLGGGRAAAGILQAQKAAQDLATAGAQNESAVKDSSLRIQEQLNTSLQKSFEIQKAGGSAAYALEQARKNLSFDIQGELWEQASAIQSQLPGLEKAAALEAQRAAEAKRLEASYAAIQESFAKGAPKPFIPVKPADPTKGIEALFGPQTKNPLEGAPDLGTPAFVKDAQSLPDLIKPGLNRGKEELDAFYAAWNRNSKGTLESINADYDAQIAHFNGLLSLGEISQAQFNDVSLKLEGERQAGLKRLREDTGASTWRDAWQDMFRQIEISGKDFARNITQDIGFAIQSLTQQMAQFITTGKGLSLKQIGQDLSTNIVSSVLKKGESSLLGMFGLGDGSKPDGSTASKALFVQFAGNPLAAGAGGLGSLPFGNLTDFGSLLGFGGNNSSPASSSGSSGGGFLSGITGFLGSIFGGFKAGGGDVTPGKAYVVGEKRPELFLPRSAGTIIPSVSSGGDNRVVNLGGVHFYGVTDADSFKRSQTQVHNTIGRAVQIAQQRIR